MGTHQGVGERSRCHWHGRGSLVAGLVEWHGALWTDIILRAENPPEPQREADEKPGSVAARRGARGVPVDYRPAPVSTRCVPWTSTPSLPFAPCSFLARSPRAHGRLHVGEIQCLFLEGGGSGNPRPKWPGSLTARRAITTVPSASFA